MVNYKPDLPIILLYQMELCRAVFMGRWLSRNLWISLNPTAIPSKGGHQIWKETALGRLGEKPWGLIYGAKVYFKNNLAWSQTEPQGNRQGQ
jgi:hypothetical protein